MDPLRVSKPSGVAHLEIKWISRWKPFVEGTKRKVVNPLRNVNPCWVTYLEAFATVGDTLPQASLHVWWRPLARKRRGFWYPGGLQPRGAVATTRLVEGTASCNYLICNIQVIYMWSYTVKYITWSGNQVSFLAVGLWLNINVERTS